MLTPYEKLVLEYETDLDITEHKLKNGGYYADNCVWISSKLSESEKLCVLAEEIGHYKTTAGDIIELDSIGKEKQEHKARGWAFELLLPKDKILHCVNLGIENLWELSEELGVSYSFLIDALKYYHFND